MSDSKSKGICFVIMPISDPEGYPKGHFKKVYDQVFCPAIEKAGYEPQRVDEDNSTQVIQVKILQHLVQAPMVLCDLSTRNPNVLFELGLRQAFDKPVVLVQECNTERIFDIANISAIDYRKDRYYDEVLEDQNTIADCILRTEKDNTFNSLISFLKISNATYDSEQISENEANQVMLRTIMNEIGYIRTTLNNPQIETDKKFNNNEVYIINADNQPHFIESRIDPQRFLSRAMWYKRNINDKSQYLDLESYKYGIDRLLEDINNVEPYNMDEKNRYNIARDILLECSEICCSKLNNERGRAVAPSNRKKVTD